MYFSFSVIKKGAGHCVQQDPRNVCCCSVIRTSVIHRSLPHRPLLNGGCSWSLSLCSEPLPRAGPLRVESQFQGDLRLPLFLRALPALAGRNAEEKEQPYVHVPCTTSCFLSIVTFSMFSLGVPPGFSPKASAKLQNSLQTAKSPREKNADLTEINTCRHGSGSAPQRQRD